MPVLVGGRVAALATGLSLCPCISGEGEGWLH